MERLLKAPELADELRVSVETIRAWTRDGLIPAIRIRPNVVRYSGQDVRAAIRGRCPHPVEAADHIAPVLPEGPANPGLRAGEKHP